MGIFDDEITLPGVITHVEADYSYGFDSSLFGSTDSVLIIGTAFNGPVNEPTAVYSPEHAAYIFGDTFDSTDNRETSLVAGVQDAWDRGCRTIYACRVGGQDMYKDFNFRIDSDYKLRVSSMFPSNIGKECYFFYDGTPGEQVVTIYKPISRATILEKKRGLTSNIGKMLKTKIQLASDEGLTADDRLVTFINKFNTNTANNVLKLSIVDREGNDVTNSPEVYTLPIGVLFSGLYMIGRDHTNDQIPTVSQVNLELVNEDTSNKPYTNFTDKYFRTLLRNTDVTVSYPIYDTNKKRLREDLRNANVTMTDDWDFLDVDGETAKAFIPDKTDYEETDLSNFEIYKRLGSGFAITAHAERRTDKDGNERKPRIRETLSTDNKRVVAIEDGLYSVLQDANMRYRALVCVNADDSIDGKLPRAKDFLQATPGTATILGNEGGETVGDISITSKTSSSELIAPIKYSIKFVDVDSKNIGDEFILPEDKIKGISTVYKVVAAVDDISKFDSVDYKIGTLMYDKATKKLYRVGVKSIDALSKDSIGASRYIIDGKVMMAGSDTTNPDILAEDTEAEAKDYLLGDVINHVFVYKKNATSSKFENIGSLTSLLSDDEDKVVVAAENLPGQTNQVIVKAEFSNITVDEVVDDLNENAIFGYLFTAKLTQQGAEEKDEFVDSAEHAKLAFEIAHQDAQPAVDPVYEYEMEADGTTTKKDEKGQPIVKKDAAGNPIVKTPGKAEVAEVKAHAAEVVTLDDRVKEYNYSLYIPYRTTDNFVRQLAQHCTYTELKTAPTHGVIGVRRLTNTSLSAIAEKTDELLSRDFDLYAKNLIGHNMLDSNNLPYPIGKNVSLVFGQYPVTIDKTSYSYLSNGASGYAGMVSTLPTEQSSTGQTIELPSLGFQLTNTQLGKLTQAGIVTFRRSYTRGYIVTDGVTMAPADSIFRRLSASRIVYMVEELIRAAGEPFIGKENHQANRNALNTAIKSNLDKIKGTLIEDYAFTMNTDPDITKLSYIEINYQIIPIYEIREIRNTIKMVDSITMSTTATS